MDAEHNEKRSTPLQSSLPERHAAGSAVASKVPLPTPQTCRQFSVCSVPCYEFLQYLIVLSLS